MKKNVTKKTIMKSTDRVTVQKAAIQKLITQSMSVEDMAAENKLIQKTAVKNFKQNPKRPIRFKSEPMTLGYIDVVSTNTFNPQVVGIVLNESYTGCALILASDSKFKINQEVKIKVGKLDPMKASIIWLKTLDENIYKVGIKFLE